MAAPLNTEKKKSKISNPMRMMKLNKTTLAILTALTFAACSEQSDFTQADIANAAVENAEKPVNFGIYLGGNVTRAINGIAGEITNASLKKGQTHEAGFGVFAYFKEGDTEDATKYTGATMPNFMWNQKVYNNSTGETPEWLYSPVKYWPNGIDAANAANKPSNTASQDKYRMLSFFAYAPYVETAGDDYGITSLPSKTATVEPSVGYTLPATDPTLATSVDLLWGLRGKASYDESDGDANYSGNYTDYNADLTKQTTTEQVKFLFKHALAQLGGLKVVADIDGNGSGLTGFGTLDAATLILVNSVNIKTVDGSSLPYKVGSLNIATGVWAGSTKYAAAISLGSYTAAGGTIDGAVKEQVPTHSTSWSPEGVTTTAKDLYSSYSPIVFIPIASYQPELEVEIEYVVRTFDVGLDATASGTDGGTWTKITQKITNKVTLPELQKNTKYTLVMHLGMTSVKFSAEVADWDDDAVKEVWLPSNVVANNTSAEVAASATSYVFDFSAYSASLGDNLTATATGTGISGDVTISGSGTSATIGLTANTTSSKVVNTVTIQGDKGKVVLTLTQLAKPIEFGDVSPGTFSVTGPSDLDLSTATITVTKGTTSYTYDATASADHYSYDNSASPKTITLPTNAGTYSVTVTQNDATLTADKTR